MNPRAVCAQIIAGVLRQEGSLNTRLPAGISKVAERDANLLQELCYGTLRHYQALEIIADTLLTKPLKKKDSDVLALILTGLYQLREMRTPAHAAVNESVAACGALRKSWARGLVNSVLRRYQRERETIDRACQENPVYLSLHPRWLQEKLEAAWGDDAAAAMAANNARPPMVLRVNARHITRADYLQTLTDAGIDAAPAPFADTGIYLQTPANVAELPGFAEGLVSVQDEAAQLSAGLLDLVPGQRVLDCCAAPGGKTCHILEHEPGLSQLVALDSDDQRLIRVAENLQRLQLEAILKVADAGQTEQWWDGEGFDRILLDAPCSATGVIRRHPDIKLLRRPGDIGNLNTTQLKILTAVWQTLKPGGRLLYATCSILPEENDNLVQTFCSQQPDCRSLAIDAEWGRATAHGRQLLPTRNGHDGFFYARLEKTANGENGL